MKTIYDLLQDLKPKVKDDLSFIELERRINNWDFMEVETKYLPSKYPDDDPAIDWVETDRRFWKAWVEILIHGEISDRVYFIGIKDTR